MQSLKSQDRNFEAFPATKFTQVPVRDGNVSGSPSQDVVGHFNYVNFLALQAPEGEGQRTAVQTTAIRVSWIAAGPGTINAQVTLRIQIMGPPPLAPGRVAPVSQ